MLVGAIPRLYHDYAGELKTSSEANEANPERISAYDVRISLIGRKPAKC